MRKVFFLAGVWFQRDPFPQSSYAGHTMCQGSWHILIRASSSPFAFPLWGLWFDLQGRQPKYSWSHSDLWMKTGVRAMCMHTAPRQETE